MKKEFIEYLESIGITGALTARVEEIFLIYSKVLGNSIDDIFVSEYLNKDGSRFYENLWFFNKEFCFEAKFFLTTDDLDSDKIFRSVTNYTIKKNDFDMVKNITSDKSRMMLDFGFIYQRHGEMKASKENCKKLLEIFLTYIQPNYLYHNK